MGGAMVLLILVLKRCPRLGELQNVEAGEVIRYAARVRRRAEADGALRRIGLRHRRVVPGHIEDEAGRLLIGIVCVDQCSAFRRHQFGVDAVTQQPHRHRVRRQDRILRAVRTGTRTVLQVGCA